MEIEYSDFEIDEKIFGENILCGVLDEDSNFIYKNTYNTKKIDFNSKQKIKNILMKEKLQNKKKLETLMNDLELTNEIYNKSFDSMSTSEKIKIAITKTLFSNTKTIILHNVDSFLTYRDLGNVCKQIRKYAKEFNKNVLFETNKIDNIVDNCDRYIIIENNEIIYSGNDLNKLPKKTSIASFVDKANKKNANINYYKEANDLLKAIYRSVEK